LQYVDFNNISIAEIINLKNSAERMNRILATERKKASR
jgi:hypothetical protein